jgi:hypothetical protein
MKLSEFMVLTTEEKRATIVKEGVPLAKRELVNHMVFLFQLPCFYAETYCCKKSKAIDEYRLFYNAEQLSPYLEAIPLDDLLNG